MYRIAWLFLVGACSSEPMWGDNPAQLVDSSGAEFTWSCADAGCSLGAIATTPALPDCDTDTPRYESAWGRFFEIDAACSDTTGWSSAPNRGRPVACSADSDCPQLGAYQTPFFFECRSGLCQSTDTTTYPVDVVSGSDAYLLCYAMLDRTATLDAFSALAQQVEAVVVASCPTSASSCTLPLPSQCAQP